MTPSIVAWRDGSRVVQEQRDPRPDRPAGQEVPAR
jgi:hypothetical protein